MRRNRFASRTLVIVAAALAATVLLLGAGRAHAAGTVEKVATFGTNPGALEMYKYVPANLPAKAPLVVFLHGCTQNASNAAKLGWNELADAYGFAVVYPQQTSANNPISCFNWAGEYGDPTNLVRGKGENQSIKEMVDKMRTDHDVNPKRVYVAGFSAGAGFTSVMLATWPDLFEGGAILAGLPYRCATTLAGASNCQALASHPELKKTPAQWGDLARAAAGTFAGRWPRVMIMQGTADGTVSPDNLPELVDQWTNVHGADQTADETTTVSGHERARYQAGGTVVVEAWKMNGMGHAVSTGAKDPEHGCTAAGGTFVEDRGICATWRMASFFGLVGEDPPDRDAGMTDSDGGDDEVDGGGGGNADGGGGGNADGGGGNDSGGGGGLPPYDPIPLGCSVTAGQDASTVGAWLALGFAGLLVVWRRRRRA